MTINTFLHRCANTLSPCRIFAMSCLLFLVFGAAGAVGAAATTDTAEKISIQRDSERVALFTVEMVSDKKAMQQGLSGRSPMPDDHGMLFILDSTAEHFFWMKGMEFSIDILFFDRDKRLIGTTARTHALRRMHGIQNTRWHILCSRDQCRRG